MTHWPDPLQARLVADRRVIALAGVGWSIAAAALGTSVWRAGMQGWSGPAAVIGIVAAAALLQALASLVAHVRHRPQVLIDSHGRLTLDGIEAPVERLDAAALARRVVPAELAAPLGRYRHWARRGDDRRSA